MIRRSLLALPPLAGLVAVIAATGKGLYVTPDAFFYVGTARNLVDGRGFTPPAGLPPLEHFPPLFTLLLAGLGKLGLDPLDGARLVNALAFAGTVLLVGLVVRARTGSVPAALVASVLTVCAVDLLTYSASALSEPLFILLALSGLVVLAAHLERPRSALLLGAALLVGAAFLTRYVGAALVVVGVGALVWRRRWADAGVFGAIAVVPVAVWLLVAEGPSDRKIVFHMFDGDYLGQAARPLSRWLVPWPKPPVGLVLAVLIVAAGVVLARRRREPPSTLSIQLVAFAVAYVALLLANRMFTDATGRLDARFLAPLHVVAILLVIRHWRALPVALVGALVLAQVVDAAAWTVGGLTEDGIGRRGYTSAAWDTSPVLAFIASEPDLYYSNAFDLIAFRTGVQASPLPAEEDYLTGRPNPAYQDQLRAMRESGGYVAYFDAVTFRRSFLPSRTELEAALPLEVVTSDSLGTLYRIR